MNTDTFVFDARDESDTTRLGRALAAALPGGTTVALCGTLGAGKTRLVQAVAEARGVDPRDVVSPTFVLIHEYPADEPIYHLDAYRLRDEDEFLELGAEEYFGENGLTLVEWADRVKNCLPPDRVDIEIDVVGPTARCFRIRARGGVSPDILARLRAALA
ncbi:MAG: tRNA (adenosine(37)-N6)-threonylcarbamoyltransferase complex ATPase subunit type 1 TsaE [Pirellulales bacterium]|nr:tRNA (adenosine(37)-N6)-threonylcarbamoyltransferase complex ATPase subunit type 1 TsaE [Pirellulales bacterium]